MNEQSENIKKQIDLYIKGLLSEDEIQALWIEFAKNPELLDELELEVGVKKLLEDEALDSKKTSPTKTLKLPTWTWHVSAAAVLLLVISFQVFQTESKTELEQFVTATIPVDQFETSDGLRSNERTISIADSLLNLGFSALVSGNADDAQSLFEEVIENFDEEPYGSKAFTNSGILLYNNGDYEASISAFDSALVRVQQSRMIEEKAYWFKGNALVNIGEFNRARTSILRAYSLDGVFRTDAFLLLQKLNYDLGYIDYEDIEGQQDN